MGRYLICWLLVLGTTQAVAGEGPWVDDPDRAMALSRQTGRPVLFHFWNEQCPPCRKVETFVFTNGQVLESLDRNFIPVKVNTTRHPELVRKYRVERIPQDVIVLPDGRIAVQTQSPLNSRNYLQMLEQVAAQSSRPDAGADVALARAIAYNDPRELGQMPRGEGAPTSDGTARERGDGVAMRHRLSGTATSNPVAAFDSVPVSAAAPALPSANPPSESRIPIVGVPTVPPADRATGPVVVSNPHVPVAAPTSPVSLTTQSGANGSAQLGSPVGGGG
ncbi:MAG TPA: thioredoxin family protein, partial [Pirellulaceae bacterium]|nr:thioredoxin family protein [Pirellulaceae bacterium]